MDVIRTISLNDVYEFTQRLYSSPYPWNYMIDMLVTNAIDSIHPDRVPPLTRTNLCRVFRRNCSFAGTVNEWDRTNVLGTHGRITYAELQTLCDTNDVYSVLHELQKPCYSPLDVNTFYECAIVRGSVPIFRALMLNYPPHPIIQPGLFKWACAGKNNEIIQNVYDLLHDANYPDVEMLEISIYNCNVDVFEWLLSRMDLTQIGSSAFPPVRDLNSAAILFPFTNKDYYPGGITQKCFEAFFIVGTFRFGPQSLIVQNGQSVTEYAYPS